MTAPIKVQEMTTIRDRLFALLETVLQDSRINKNFIPIIRNLAKNFLEGASDDDLIKGITALRDQFIPWILQEEDQPHEDQDQIG